VQVTLEGSGKWPADAAAAQKMKAALGCEIAAALEAQWGMHARAAERHVDVYADGFALRLHLWSDRDDALADRCAKVRISGSASMFCPRGNAGVVQTCACTRLACSA
jgi:Nrap protein nucleotidyltransferase domain 4